MPTISDKEPSIEIRIALLEQAMKEVRETLAERIERTNLIIADEKDTRLLMNERWLNSLDNFGKRLSILEKHVFIAMGAVIALQFITPILMNLLKK